MRALHHQQKYQSSLFGLWLIRAPRGRSVQVATAVLPVPSIFQCSNQTASPMLMLLLSLLTLPYLTSHRSSTTLIIFPPPRRASIGPLSDDNQHEAPISTPTLHVGHLHPHQFCSIHGCRPVLIPHPCAITSCATRVLHGPRPLSQLACSPCAPSTPLFFSLSRQIIARHPWRVRGSFRSCPPSAAVTDAYFNFVFLLCL